MTTLYLVRHGETTDNVAKIMQGQRQGELTPAGQVQIGQLADKLVATHFDAIVASDLRRAYDSAQIIASHIHLPILTTPLLRERDWGDFTGRYIPDLQGVPFPENVEKLEALLLRARQFLDWVVQHHEGKTVVAVGHGIINKAIQAVHYDKPMTEIPRMANAECRVLGIGALAINKSSLHRTSP